MNGPKRNNHRAQMISPFLLLSTAISAQSMNRESYRQQVAYFLVNESDSLFETRFEKLLRTRRFYELLNAHSTRIEDFGMNVFAAYGFSTKRAWAICRFLLKRNAAKINTFVGHRDRIERSIVLGNLETALSEIALMISDVGESFWAVRCKIAVLSALERNEEFDKYCDEVKQRAGNSTLRYLFHCCQILAGSDNAGLQLEAVVLQNTAEFKETGLDSLAGQLELLFVPSPLRATSDYAAFIERIQLFPIVDQYSFVLRILAFATVDFSFTGTSKVDNLDDLLAELNREIYDPALMQLQNKNVQVSGEYKSAVGDLLLRLYTLGKYDEVIAVFAERKDELDNPLAYVNLVGKSAAISNREIQKAKGNDLLLGMADSLSKIYKLDSLWLQAEEKISSLAIKYHFLTQSAHIQFALFKALPFRYPEESVEVAARLAIVSHREVTPLTQVMHDRKRGQVVDINFDNEIPYYRKLKRELFSYDPKITGFDAVKVKFDELRLKCPLVKDYIELLSWYCILADESSLLISYSAKLIAEDANRYICIPLSR